MLIRGVRLVRAVIVTAVVAVLASCSAPVSLAPSTHADRSDRAQSPSAIDTSVDSTPDDPKTTGISTADVSTTPAPPRTTPTQAIPTVDHETKSQVTAAWSAVAAEWEKLLPDGWPLPTLWNGDGLYDASRRDTFPGSWMTGPVCNGELAPAVNASYCPTTDTMSWDLGYVQRFRAASGTLALVETLAHELGHAAQQRLRQTGQTNLIWPQRELQADCFAGAVIYEASGDGLIDVSSGDLEDLYAFLAIISDSEPAFGSATHGNQRQRELSFTLGQGDIGSCFSPTGPPIDIALPVPQPDYPGAEGDPHFSLIMPSGNIWCIVSADHIECTIREFTFDGNCSRGDMPLVTLYADGPARQNSCGGRGILTDALDPIAYGQTVWLPPAMCTAATDGLTCMNDDGHGFTLARAGLHSF